MIRTRTWLLCAAALSFLTTCKKPFNPVIVQSNVNILVVEGTINTGNDTTFIKLSRTVKIDSNTVKPETGATIAVQGDDNSSYPLNVYSTAGTYYVTGLNLSTSHKYRLDIHTSDGHEYQSDYVENKVTPPIDSLNYLQVGDGVQMYVTSHDPNNGTRYYRWDFDETWSYYSAIQGVLKWENGQVEYLTADEMYHECYKFAHPSNTVYVGSSAKLAKDVLYKAPLAYVYASSGKLAHVYSILIRQYALTADGYNYWSNLKKNTETLGSIFDAQPSTLAGNIHSVTDPKEVVIGFISASTVTSLRYFIEGRNLNLAVPNPPSVCTGGGGVIPVDPELTLNTRLHATLDHPDTLLVNQQTNPMTGAVTGYIYAPAICVDCRLAGGTNVKPSYWPY